MHRMPPIEHASPAVMPRFHSPTEIQNAMLPGMRTGRDRYAAIYGAQLEAEAKWLAIGAVEKANSIERLVLPRISHPKRIVELGAGTGAIIAELQRRNFADVYVAVDYSTDATDYMKRNLTNVEVLRADIVEEPVYGAFDVVIVSHVLEHLESPDDFLAALVRNLDFRFAVIECPLEDLAASRLKNLFRNRDENRAGHVQFFNRRSLSAVLRRHLKIVADRHYCSWASSETVRFLANKDALPLHKHWIKHLTLGVLPRVAAPLWKRYWIGNYALLCQK
jgi:SAM-dependent methyltransferase